MLHSLFLREFYYLHIIQFSLENISKKSNIEELKNGLIKLKRQLEEEKSNSKQAAEYGLSLLDDFKKLQTKND